MFLEKNRDRIEKDFEDFSRELPGKAEEIEKRMETLNADIVIGMWEITHSTPIWIMSSRESGFGKIPLM